MDDIQDGSLDGNGLNAIGRLKPERRAVVVMRFHLDMSHAQRADRINCSVGTAGTRRHRALADLEVTMNELDHDDEMRVSRSGNDSRRSGP
jgi:DNA-directed RNA polymerase specialized sigma24 family protein